VVSRTLLTLTKLVVVVSSRFEQGCKKHPGAWVLHRLLEAPGSSKENVGALGALHGSFFFFLVRKILLQNSVF
jgi:hypothetical protein